MNTVKRILIMVLLPILLMSATYTNKNNNRTTHTISQVHSSLISHTGAKKQSFFSRLFHRLTDGKVRGSQTEQADKLAKTSLILGIVSVGIFLLGLAVPILFLASIPIGAAAMITGNIAIKKGTEKYSDAALGKGLGLGTLLAAALITIIVVIAVASFF